MTDRVMRIGYAIKVKFKKDSAKHAGIPDDAIGILVEADNRKIPTCVVSLPEKYRIPVAFRYIDSYGYVWDNCIRIFYKHIEPADASIMYDHLFEYGDEYYMHDPRDYGNMLTVVVRGECNGRVAVEVKDHNFFGTYCHVDHDILLVPSGSGMWVYPHELHTIPFWHFDVDGKKEKPWWRKLVHFFFPWLKD